MKKALALLKRLLLERSLRYFLLIGLGNTVLSLLIQLSAYSWLGLGYWASSALAFCIASISSFYFNRKYSFQSQGDLLSDALRFSVNIAVCYLLAYAVAQPLVDWVVPRLNVPVLTQYLGQVSLVVGNGLFTCLNYFGQRFFAFQQRT